MVGVIDMASKMILNVASIRRYSVNDEKTGKVNEGVTVFVVQETEDLTGNTLGCDVAQMTGPLSLFQKAKDMKWSFPSEIVCSVSMKRGAGGKASFQVLDMDIS